MRVPCLVFERAAAKMGSFRGAARDAVGADRDGGTDAWSDTYNTYNDQWGAI